MKCSRARQMLQDSEGGLRSVRRLRSALRWLHTARCGACRAEARSVRLLRRALRDIGRFQPPAELLARILDVPACGTAALGCDRAATLRLRSGRAAGRGYISTKGDRRMRRIAFAGVALLVVAIGAAVMIPGRGHKADARTILIAAAQAMEEAETVYAAVRGTEDAKDRPSGMKLSAGTMLSWVGPRAMYGHHVTPDGKLTVAIMMNLDSRELSVYDDDKHIRYVADFAPIAPKAPEFMARVLDTLRWAAISGKIKQVFEAAGLQDVKESVASELRDGRKVNVVTVEGVLKTQPQRVSDRWVFEVDAATNHMLTARRYVQAEGGAEELILSVDKVQYDVPPPAQLSAFEIPEGTKTVQATAVIEQTEKTMSLVMKAEGRVFMRSEVPLAAEK